MPASWVKTLGGASHVGNITHTDVTLTDTPAAGNLVVVSLAAQGNDLISSVTDSAGNTWIVGPGIANGTVVGSSIAYTFQDVLSLSASDVITVNHSTSPGTVCTVEEYADVDPAVTPEQFSGTTSGTSAALSCVVTVDEPLLVGAAGGSAGDTLASGATCTLRGHGEAVNGGVVRCGGVYDRVAASAGTYDLDAASSSGSKTWALAALAFQSAVTTPPPGPQTIEAILEQGSSVKVPEPVIATGTATVPADDVASGGVEQPTAVQATGSAAIPMDSFGSGAVITPGVSATGSAAIPAEAVTSGTVLTPAAVISASSPQTIPAQAVSGGSVETPEVSGTGSAAIPMDSFGSGSVITPGVSATGSAVIPGPINGDPGSIHTPTLAVTGTATIAAEAVDSSSVLTPAAVSAGATLLIQAEHVDGGSVGTPTIAATGVAAPIVHVREQGTSVKVPASVTAGAPIPQTIDAVLVDGGSIHPVQSIFTSGASIIEADLVESGTVGTPDVGPTGSALILGLREQGTSIKKPKSVTAGAAVPQSIPAVLVSEGTVYAPASVATPPGTPQTIFANRVQNSSVKIPVGVTVGDGAILPPVIESSEVFLAQVLGGNPFPNVWGWGEGHMETLASDERARIMATVRAAVGPRGIIRCDLDTTNFALTMQSKYVTFDAEVAAHDLVWLPVLHSTWASSTGKSRYQIPPRDGGAGEYAMQSWYEWVYYIVQQTGKHAYEVWNEPNTTTGNGKSGASGDMAYADLQDIVEAATDAIRDAAANLGIDTPYILGPALGSIDVAYLEGWIDWAEANGRRNPLTLYDSQPAHVYAVDDPALPGGLAYPRRIRTFSDLRALIDARYTGTGDSPDMSMTEWSYACDSRPGGNKFNGETEPIIWEEPEDGAANAYDYTVGLLDQISLHPEWRLTYRPAYHPIDHNPLVTASDHKYESFGAFYNSTGTGAIPENLWKGNGRAISERALADPGQGEPQVITAERIQDSSVKVPVTVFSAAAPPSGELVIRAITVMPCYTGSTETSLLSGHEQVVTLANPDQELSL